MADVSDNHQRPRLRELGIDPGLLPPGDHNSITDVPSVNVGHSTLIEGSGPLRPGEGPIRTGVTVVVPREESVYENKVTAATHVLNGHGKSIGFTQVDEFGTIETPILLTNTLNVWNVANHLHEYMADHHSDLVTSNPIVGECYDGYLNDISGRHVGKSDVETALGTADSPSSEEGNVGGGTGMTGFGWKGGVGTSSRVVEIGDDTFTLGALVQTNTGDPHDLRIPGVAVGEHLLPPDSDSDAGGSIMMVVGTDAPVTTRQMGRIAKRAPLGLGRTGGLASHTSGDYVIAFSNGPDDSSLEDAVLTPLFRATVESVEEAILNSVLRAETMVGRDGNTRHAIPIPELTELINENS